MAKPIADSAAATVKTYKAKTWPIMSSKYTEKKIKFKFSPTNINSIDIKTTNKLRLFSTKPKTPKRKIIVETVSRVFKEKKII